MTPCSEFAGSPGVDRAAPGDEGPVLPDARDGVFAPHGPHEQPDEVGELSDRLPAHHQALLDSLGYLQNSNHNLAL